MPSPKTLNASRIDKAFVEADEFGLSLVVEGWFPIGDEDYERLSFPVFHDVLEALEKDIANTLDFR